MQAGGEQRAVNPRCELLHARVHRLATHGTRCGLDDACAGVGLHQAQKPHETFAAYHAVRIHDHHVAIVPAPTAAEIGDVAALALNAVLAPAIEYVSEAIDGAAERVPRIDLGDTRVRIARI